KKQRLQLIKKQIKKAGFNMQLVKPMVGHSSLEKAQPGLLETIVQIVSSDGQANYRRHSEIVRSIKTLDQLQEVLTNMNYKLSRSATYFRLISKWHNTNEGRWHVKTVPVKLLKLQNTARRSHIDTRFCAALIRNLKEIVSLLGPKCALVISQDDKAQIPLGLAAANKQAPILMRLEYRIELLDHDWVVAEKHKLILSVYAILDIQEGKYGHTDAVTYSGPTFIRIHSVVMLSDGGPNENPRYRKTIQMMIEHFDKYNLDTIIVAYFAPHQSASNPVERRMAPLSHDLAGVILPHDTFETYLDSQLKTNDDELEKHPSEEYHYPSKKSESWIENKFCQILLNHFFSSPIMVQQKPNGICVATMNVSDDTIYYFNFLLSTLMEGKLIPPDMNLWCFLFDWYCLTINKSINEYICLYCNRYFALKRNLKYHIRKCLYKKSNLSVKPSSNIQDFQVSNDTFVHNHRQGEFLISNEGNEAM
ncbi:3087_t:CDS:2, partial [Dentiscutata erythropus]